MPRDGFFVRGGGWVIAQNTLTVATLVLAPLSRTQGPHPVTTIIGATLFCFGAAFGVAGVVALGPNLTPYPRPRDDSVLVRRGVYSLVRHPLYSSLMLISIGWALCWSSAAGLAVAVVLTVLLYTKSRREEQWLRHRYSDYGSYERRVKRFIPGVW